MADTPRFLGRIGLDNDFFEPYKIAHLAVEAPIESVSAALESAGDLFSLRGGEKLRFERDVFGKACGEEWPLANLFQLRGQSWTQVAADIRKVKALPLGRFLSRELETRCLCIEVTDDAYQSHALFDNGVTEDIYLLSMNVDMSRTLTELDLEVPDEYRGLDPEDFDLFDEAEYCYRRDGSPAADPAKLVVRVGCYLRTPTFGESVHSVAGLQADDLVRMDVIWAEPA
jgi:hypothetical protein